MAKWEQLAAARERKHLSQFDSMNVNDKNYQMTRRDALCSLATLPLIALGLVASGNTVQRSHHKDALEQCAASVEACWELRLSDNPSDRLLAFQCTTTYLSLLESILLDSLQHREEILHLATRYTIIKAHLARHCVGLAEAIQYGKDAVALSKETGDSLLQILSTLFLAQSYLCAKKYKLAFTTAQASEAYWLQHTRFPNAQPLHPYVKGKIYSTLARMQVKNGVSPEASLSKAIGTQPSNESYDFIEFKYSNLLLDAGGVYCHYGEQTKAMKWLEQRVDPETLLPKFAQSKIGFVQTINLMTLSSLRVKERDMEKSIHFWKAGAEEAKALKSELRFSEAIANYELMQAIWSGESRIEELRDYLVHWTE